MHGLTQAINEQIYAEILMQRISPIRPLWTRTFLLANEQK
jgi:hypothetical protein